jgi:hypothetical protein
MTMLRTPLPNADLARLESCGPEELLGLFESCLKTGSKRSAFVPLPDAWGKLFSDLYLSAEEMVDGMERGEHRLSDGHAQMLRAFIRADGLSGGSFVLEVIKSGGKIDRAALILIADLEDLAGIEQNGMTAIHLLVSACDKRVRPALIRRAGKRLLSQLYDRRGLPVIFSIFGLCDLDVEDLDAIASVFSRDELREIMSKNRSGNNALDLFTNASASMKRYPRMERNALVRNAFHIPAAKDTMKEGAEPPVRIEKISGGPAENQNQ